MYICIVYLPNLTNIYHEIHEHQPNIAPMLMKPESLMIHRKFQTLLQTYAYLDFLRAALRVTGCDFWQKTFRQQNIYDMPFASDFEASGRFFVFLNTWRFRTQKVTKSIVLSETGLGVIFVSDSQEFRTCTLNNCT